MRRREILKILLSVLIAIFIMVAAAALLLAGFRKSADKASYSGSYSRRNGSSFSKPDSKTYGYADSYSYSSRCL